MEKLVTIVNSKKTEGSKCEIEFKIEADKFSEAVSKTYRKTASKYNIPGFRKGKAPRNVIEKMYGNDVFFYDAINDIFPDEYDEVVKELTLEPVDRPEVDIVNADLKDGVVLKVIVVVTPEVTLGEYKGLKATRKAAVVEEEVINEALQKLQERNARTLENEGAAKLTDIANIDFEGFVDGVPFEGGKGENFALTLGSGQFIPGFEEQIVGHKALDEFDVTVTFPTEYQAAELAGKEAVFAVKVNSLQTKELPELDDEFAKDVSEFDTLDELKDSIKKEKLELKDKENDLEVENALVDQIVDELKADIPPIMFENRVQEMMRDFEGRLRSQGLDLKNYLKYSGSTLDEFKEGFKEQSEKQVKIRLALDKICKNENITANEEQVEKELQRIAELYKMELDKVKEIVPVEDIKQDLAINNTIDYIKSVANIEQEK